MAVAALSTSALALATAPATLPAPAGEAPGAFAQLVSQAKPDGQAPQRGAAPEMIDGEAETADAPGGAATGAETEIEGTKGEEPVDLLAELEALFAFAGQTGAAAPPAAMPPAAIVASPAADAVTPDQAGVSNARPAQAAGIATPVVPAASEPNAALLPSAAPKAEQASVPALPAAPAAATAASRAAVASQTEADIAPAETGTHAEAGVETAATTPLRRDIAAIVASLKSAFQPAGIAEDRLPPAAAPPLTDPVAASFIQSPATAIATAPSSPPAQLGAAVAISAPADIPTPTPTPIVGEAMLRAAGVSTLVSEVPASRTARSPGIDRPKPASVAAPDPAPVPAAPATPETALSAATPMDGSAPDTAELAAPIAPLSAAVSPSPAAAPEIPVVIATAIGTEAPLADTGTASSTPADQSIARQLDLARDTQWLDQLARDISQSVTRQGHLKFQLNPEHLGALTVEIANSAAGTSIKLSAETDQARAIIADAQPRLIAEVRAQGVRVAESHVDLNQQGSGGSAFAQGQQRQSSENSKPFAPTQTVNRDDAGDSASRDDGELYA